MVMARGTSWWLRAGTAEVTAAVPAAAWTATVTM